MFAIGSLDNATAGHLSEEDDVTTAQKMLLTRQDHANVSSPLVALWSDFYDQQKRINDLIDTVFYIIFFFKTKCSERPLITKTLARNFLNCTTFQFSEKSKDAN